MDKEWILDFYPANPVNPVLFAFQVFRVSAFQLFSVFPDHPLFDSHRRIALIDSPRLQRLPRHGTGGQNRVRSDRDAWPDPTTGAQPRPVFHRDRLTIKSKVGDL